jgi:shikimate kinase
MSFEYSDKLTKNPNDPIYLIGMMGAGKTTLGQALATDLGRSFIDTDSYIADRLGYTVSQIFGFYGNKEFRKLESSALFNLKNKRDVIIATGGGLPCFYQNMDIMLSSGKVIYLLADADMIIDRLKGDISRPLLRYKSELELRHYIEALLQEREGYYNRADLFIEASKDIKSNIEHIRTAIGL